jgi:hypothetical protein
MRKIAGVQVKQLYADEKGVTIVAVIGILFMILALTSVGVVLVQSDRMGIFHRIARDEVVNIAEAGVNDYVWRLNKDPEYFLTTVHPAQGQDASGDNRWLAYGRGAYHLEITPPSDNIPLVTVESTGRVRGPSGSYVERKITAQVKKRAFTNYIYLTDYEVIEATNNYIWWITGDVVRGPLHTNDDLHTNGTPRFMKEVTMTGILDNHSGTPIFEKGYKTNVEPLDFPVTNLKLKDFAEQAGYYYYGETTITLEGATLNIVNSDTTGKTTGPTGNVTEPGNGVIYVDGSASAKYRGNNGDVFVAGTYSGELTIAARNIIYITDDVRYMNPATDMLGLVADNYVYINHYNRTGQDVAPVNIEVDAAIAAVKHSFGYERYNDGAVKGTLTVVGSITQKYRGPVGTFSGSQVVTGYVKDYEFDQRMLYHAPPRFLEPANSGFEIVSWNESAP